MRKIRVRVKEIAAAKGMSMTKLHKQSDVAYSVIRTLFRDPYHEVTLTTIARLGQALDVPTSELLEDVENGEE